MTGQALGPPTRFHGVRKRSRPERARSVASIQQEGSTLSSHKTDQRRIAYRGKEFHFVSYEGHLANPTRGVEAMPPTWFLMRAGKRWEVMPVQVQQEEVELDHQLQQWLDENVFCRAS